MPKYCGHEPSHWADVAINVMVRICFGQICKDVDKMKI